jgi:hypothetical protein
MEPISQMAREDWAGYERQNQEYLKQMMVEPDQPPTPEEERESTPERFREQPTRVGDQELLLHRWFTAQLTCRQLVQVGRSHPVP